MRVACITWVLHGVRCKADGSVLFVFPFIVKLNTVHKKIEGEGEPGTKPHPPVAFELLLNHNQKGHRLVRFHTGLSLSFKFSCIIFARERFKGRDREGPG